MRSPFFLLFLRATIPADWSIALPFLSLSRNPSFSIWRPRLKRRFLPSVANGFEVLLCDRVDHPCSLGASLCPPWRIDFCSRRGNDPLANDHSPQGFQQEYTGTQLKERDYFTCTARGTPSCFNECPFLSSVGPNGSRLPALGARCAKAQLRPGQEPGYTRWHPLLHLDG